MAANLSHTSSTDNLLDNDELEMEKKQQCSHESPSHYDSDDTHGVPITGTNQCTKPRLSVSCTGERVNHSMIAVMFVAVLSLAVMLAVINVALIMYVGKLYHRVDRLETQCSSTGTYLMVLNKTQLNSSSELEDQGEILLHLSTKLEKMEDRIYILEITLSQLNRSLSSSLLLLIGADEAASNNISDLQRSLGLIKEDVDLTKIQLQNLSSMYTNLQSDYDATIHDIHMIRAVTEQNVSQLHNLIHQVEKNHSSILLKLSRYLDKAAMNSSTLTQRIDHTLKLVGSQGQTIDGIRSDVTEVRNSVTGLHGALTTNINNLNTRINEHMDRTQNSLVDHSQMLNNFGSRIRAVEQQLASDAMRVVPLGFLLLSAIALFVCYIIM